MHVGDPGYPGAKGESGQKGTVTYICTLYTSPVFSCLHGHIYGTTSY